MVFCDVTPCHYVSNAWWINRTLSFVTSAVPSRDTAPHLRRSKTSEIPQWESHSCNYSYFHITYHLCIRLERLCKHTPNQTLSLDLLHPEVLLLKLSFLTHYHLKHIKQIQQTAHVRYVWGQALYTLNSEKSSMGVASKSSRKLQL